MILRVCSSLLFLFSVTYPAMCFDRIVSLNVNVTASIYLLEEEEHLIANTVYCTRPEEAKKKIKVGTVLNADIERIVSLKPDLIIAGSLSNPSEIKKLKKLGLNIRIFREPSGFEELAGQFLELGELLGRKKKAEEILKAAKGKVTVITNKKNTVPKPKVLVQLGINPLFAATGKSFVNDYITLAGGVNIAEKAKSGLYSMERVIKDNPDVIIIADMGIEGKTEILRWNKYQSINAVRDGRIYIFDSYDIGSPTPEIFAVTLEKIFRLFYPDKIIYEGK